MLAPNPPTYAGDGHPLPLPPPVYHDFSDSSWSTDIFAFTAAGECDSEAAVKGFPALHYSVYFIVLSFRIMDSIVELRGMAETF